MKATSKTIKPVTKADKALHEFINYEVVSVTYSAATDRLPQRKRLNEILEDHIRTDLL